MDLYSYFLLGRYLILISDKLIFKLKMKSRVYDTLHE